MFVFVANTFDLKRYDGFDCMWVEAIKMYVTYNRIIIVLQFAVETHSEA